MPLIVCDQWNGQIAYTEGLLEIRAWEHVFYGEFDGRRRKRVLVKIIAE